MKKILAIMLVVLLAAGSFAACSSAENNTGSKDTAGNDGGSPSSNEEGTSSVLKDGKDTVLTVMFPGNNSTPASLDAVNKAITEIARETIDCTVELKIVEWGVYAEQQNLLLSSGEPIDLVFALANVSSTVNNGQVLDITDLAPVYAPESMELMGRYIDACKINGALYGFPTYRDFASASGLVCVTEILNELGVDPETIKTWDDVGNLLAKVKETHPELDVLVPSDMSSGMTGTALNGVFDGGIAGVGIYADGRDGLTVYNTHKTDEFMEFAKRAYDWNQKGYFIADPTTITDTRQTFFKAGSAFGFIGTYHPGVQAGEGVSTGVDMTAIQITEATSGTTNITTFQYLVPASADSPEKSVALMNLMFSNPEVQNLLRFGIEGTDYVVNNGVASYPDGVNNENVGWYNETFLTGNATIGYKWVTEPSDIWEKYQEFNDGAKLSPAYGFSYNSEGVKAELTAVQNVLNKYTPLIYAGLAEPEETVAELNKELESAGIDNIVKDVQAQLDAWSAKQ